MNRNTSPSTEQNPVITDENSDFGSASLRTPDSGVTTEAVFRSARESTPQVHSVIYELVENYNLQAETIPNVHPIPIEIIDLPTVFTNIQTDSDGDRYITDLNNVIKYYMSLGVIVPTDDFKSNADVVANNQRNNSFSTIYNVI